jgi:hypothetical protein
MDKLYYFHHLEMLVNSSQVVCIEKIPYIYRRAVDILDGINIIRLSKMAVEFNAFISHKIEQRIEFEIEKLADSIVEDSSWELKFPLPGKHRNDVIKLLKNWPDHLPCPNPAPKKENFDEVDILLNVRSELGDNTEVAKKFALLSMVKLQEVATPILLQVIKHKTLEIRDVAELSAMATNSAVTAMEAICYAENFLSKDGIYEKHEFRFRQFKEDVGQFNLEHAHQRTIKEIASKGGRKKSQRYDVARKFIKDEWKSKASEYESKDDFARCYVNEIAQTISDSDGKPLKVVPTTIVRWINS